MFDALEDPYSNFLDDNTFRLLDTGLKGYFGGIGFSFTKTTDKLVISYIFPDSPAKRAGLKPGDGIIKVNGSFISKLSLQKIVDKLRGKPGSKVKLTIKLAKNKKIINKTITRQIIKPIIVEYKVLKNNIGYIRLRSFSNNSSKSVRKALISLRGKAVKGLIFDIRNNLGGDLLECIYITNFFLSDDKKILSMREKDEKYKTHLYSDNNYTILPNIPLVVLVNGNSASASEIFLGAIQDHKRGIAIGSKTYGKGSVQSYMASEVKPTIGFKITHSKWFTPKNRAIDRKGLKPDIEIQKPKLSIDEKYYVIRLYKSKLVKDYVKNHKELSDNDVDNFMKIIKQRGIALKKAIVIKHLKKEKYSLSYETIIDMDYDKPLKKAWDYLNKKAKTRKHSW